MFPLRLKRAFESSSKRIKFCTKTHGRLLNNERLGAKRKV